MSESEDDATGLQAESLQPTETAAGFSGSDDKNSCKVFGEEHVNQTKNILDNIQHRSVDVGELVTSLTELIRGHNMSTQKGMTFLEMKNVLMLQYLMGLVGVIFTKLTGKSLKGSSFVDTLIQLRVILEKLRKIDDKLKYQIDKLIRNATNVISENDPLAHKANLDNFSDEDDSDDEQQKTSSKSDVYCPPKIAAVSYDEEKDNPGKQMERAKKASFSRQLIREMQEEFLDTPVEIQNKGEGFSYKNNDRKINERIRYEETYMTRLPETKKDKEKKKSVSTIGALGDEITDFHSFQSKQRTSKSGKRKSSGGKTGKGPKKKKRFKFT